MDLIKFNLFVENIAVYLWWHYGTSVVIDHENGARAAALSRLAASICPKVFLL